jgi:hypothetical protein
MRTSISAVVENLRNEIGNGFVIGVDSASRLLGLSPNKGLPLTILSTQPLTVTTPDVEVVIVENIVLDNAESSYGAIVTSVEQTICDMLRYERNPQTIVEAMCHYYYSHGEPDTWGSLRQIAEDHGVLDAFEDYIEDALAHAEN